MASRFWVGGTATWDGTAGTKWATTTGGAGGAAVPTSADAVKFDAASGAVTVTVSGDRVCDTLDLTGFTGTIGSISAGTIVATDDVILVASVVAFNPAIRFVHTTGTAFLRTFGKAISALTINAPGGTVTLIGALTVTGVFTLEAGTFDASNQDVIGTTFFSDYATARTLSMGSGVWTFSGSGGSLWNCGAGTNLTINESTSILKFTSTSGTKTFAGGSKQYREVWIEGSGTSIFTITGSNTFRVFKVINPPRTINFTNGSTQTITTTWTVSGTAGNLITLHSQTLGQPWSLSKASGTVTSDYVALRDSQGIGGATFTATNFTDEGGNSGWNGLGIPGGSHRMFLMFALLMGVLMQMPTLAIVVVPKPWVRGYR